MIAPAITPPISSQLVTGGSGGEAGAAGVSGDSDAVIKGGDGKETFSGAGGGGVSVGGDNTGGLASGSTSCFLTNSRG